MPEIKIKQKPIDVTEERPSGRVPIQRPDHLPIPVNLSVAIIRYIFNLKKSGIESFIAFLKSRYSITSISTTSSCLDTAQTTFQPYNPISGNQVKIQIPFYRDMIEISLADNNQAHIFETDHADLATAFEAAIRKHRHEREMELVISTLTSIIASIADATGRVTNDNHIPSQKDLTELRENIGQEQDIAAINSGVAELHLEEVTIQQILYNSILEHAHNNHEITPVYQIPNGPITVEVDEIRMQRVISNLLDHALNLSNKSPCDISFKVFDQVDQIEIRITYLSTQYEQSQTSDSLSSTTSNQAVVPNTNRITQLKTDLEIRLYYCEQIINAHHGTIQAKKDLTTETVTFTINLPKRQTQPSPNRKD